ncbi:26S proteasome regulatory subunit rpn11 [Colletotrichum sp. SAR 10_65]|nr:26S proteasome regulatory subunit rpn11 [Colletotrichum sp. SAR 10_65]
MERFRNMLQSQGLGGLGSQPGTDNTQLIDNSETVYISSLALLKMLRHGRAGVPMEVMGLMLGEFVDDFTVRVVDVFAMPQSGTGVSVEAVDPVFQMKMMDMLRQTGRPEAVVGWYHSHPGFGCWLSSVDINTQQSFEQLTPRAVAVVVDPIQSVKGKVVIDAFRLINPQSLMLGQEPRQSTSNLGHLNKPSIQALIHGLNRHYYSIGINYRKTALEENMLMNLHKHVWTEALEMNDFRAEADCNKERLERLVSLAEGYEKRVKEETELTKDQLKTRYVGKLDPKKHLEDVGQQLIEDNIVSVSRQMIDKEATMPKKDGAKGQSNGDSMDVEEEFQYTDVSLPPSPPLRMSKLTLFEVLHRIGHAFSHVQYAVCGTAAMVAFGFGRRKPTHVSIVCPSHTRDVLASWAVAGGMMLYPSNPNDIGVPVDEDIWTIQVKYLETDDNHRFERLYACHFNFGCDDVTTAVLTPAAQLEQIAQVYINPRYNQSWRYKERLGGDAIWLLEQMCKEGVNKFGMNLRNANIPTIRDQRFWLVFTTAHPEAVGLFYDAGLRDEEEEEYAHEYEQEYEREIEQEYDKDQGPEQEQSNPDAERRAGVRDADHLGSVPAPALAPTRDLAAGDDLLNMDRS